MLQSVEVLSGDRRSVRRAVTLSADVLASEWDAPRRHDVRDLSALGLGLAGAPLAAGEEVIVSFALPAVGEVCASARVVRVERGAGHAVSGLELLDLPADAALELERALRGTPPPLSRRRRRELVWIELLPAARRTRRPSATLRSTRRVSRAGRRAGRRPS